MQIKRKGKGLGLALLVISIVAFLLYAYVLIFSGWSMIVIQTTMLAAVGILLLLLGWIGYTMMSAPNTETTK